MTCSICTWVESKTVSILPVPKLCPIRFQITKKNQELVQTQTTTAFCGILGDKNRFDVSSKGPSSGISVGGVGENTRVFIQVNILKQHVTK